MVGYCEWVLEFGIWFVDVVLDLKDEVFFEFSFKILDE